MTPREKMIELAREAVQRLSLSEDGAHYEEALSIVTTALYDAGYDGANVTDVALEVAAVYATKQ